MCVQLVPVVDSVLVLLDLFNTIDPDIVMNKLKES